MLWPHIGNSLMLIMIFAVPTGWGMSQNMHTSSSPTHSSMPYSIPQTTSPILHFMYLWLPMIFNFIMTLLLSRLNVEKANADWDREHQA